MRKVPELSLLSFVQGSSNDQARFVDSFIAGLKDYGFIILTDHTVDAKLREKAYDLAHEFFNLPEEIKRKYVVPGAGGQKGYTAFGKENAKNNPYPDLKEFWHVGRDYIPGTLKNNKFSNIHAVNVWPSEVKEFQQVMSTLYASLDKTAQILAHALEKGLDTPPYYISSMVNNGNSTLRVLHYPPLAEQGLEKSIRSAAHEDINLYTILMGATASGLQLLDRDQKWLDVNTQSDQLVIDSGDMLSRITNDVIPSTTHRVINTQEGKSQSRYSMPYFVHAHPDTILSCIPSCVGAGRKYSDIDYNEFLAERLRAIGIY